MQALEEMALLLGIGVANPLQCSSRAGFLLLAAPGLRANTPTISFSFLHMVSLSLENDRDVSTGRGRVDRRKGSGDRVKCTLELGPVAPL